MTCPRCGVSVELPPHPPAPDPFYDDVSPAGDTATAPLSVWGYLWSGFLLHIPILGLLIQLCWALGGARNRNRRNYAIACLIWTCLTLATLIVLLVMFFRYVYPQLEAMLEYAEQLATAAR